MHCEANTLNGQLKFHITFADGTTLSETEVLWDEVPADKAILALELRDADGISLAALQGAERYWFGNEAVSVSNFVPAPNGDLAGTYHGELLSGKLIGGVFGDQARELKLDLLKENPEVLSRDFEASKVRYSPSAMRKGLVASERG